MTDRPAPDALTWIITVRQIVDAIKQCPDVVDKMDDIIELAFTEGTLEAVRERIVELTDIPDDIADLEAE